MPRPSTRAVITSRIIRPGQDVPPDDDWLYRMLIDNDITCIDGVEFEEAWPDRVVARLGDVKRLERLWSGRGKSSPPQVE